MTTYSSLFKGEDVALLELVVIGVVLLNGVVCQVDEQVICLRQVVDLARHANVPFFEQVTLVLRCDHDPEADVELALVDQEWFFNVLLEHKDV